MYETPSNNLGGVPQVHNLISLCGERRRGKDYLTNLLIQRAPFPVARLSFSDEVRHLAQMIFPWFNAFDDSQKEKVYDHPNNTMKVTGRDILLTAGKVRDVDGQYFARAFLKNQMPKVLANPGCLYVITDFRTPEEFEKVIQPYGVPTIKVLRNVDLNQYPPHAFEEYIRTFKPDYFFNNEEGGDKIINLIESLRREGKIQLTPKW